MKRILLISTLLGIAFMAQAQNIEVNKAKRKKAKPISVLDFYKETKNHCAMFNNTIDRIDPTTNFFCRYNIADCLPTTSNLQQMIRQFIPTFDATIYFDVIFEANNK